MTKRAAATHVALLRAVNVGGTKRLPMADLREFFAALGFERVRTLLQSGNVVFATESRSSADLESLLEAEARDRLGLDTAFVVRSADRWRKILRANPFEREAASMPGKLATYCLKKPASAKAVRDLREAIRGREVVRGRGKEVYVVYPDGMGRSKLTTAVVERCLGGPATARNWNTVLKIDAALRAAD